MWKIFKDLHWLNSKRLLRGKTLTSRTAGEEYWDHQAAWNLHRELQSGRFWGVVTQVVLSGDVPAFDLSLCLVSKPSNSAQWRLNYLSTYITLNVINIRVHVNKNSFHENFPQNNLGPNNCKPFAMSLNKSSIFSYWLLELDLSVLHNYLIPLHDHILSLTWGMYIFLELKILSLFSCTESC